MIAIMGLLAAILFPAFSRVRENARRTACQSNLKQIGMGIQQYTQDYDERLPSRIIGPGTGNEMQSWRRVIYPYVKSTQVFACPSNPGKNTIANDSLSSVDATAFAALGANPPLFPVSYLCNGDESSGGTTGVAGTPPMGLNAGQSLAAIGNTTQTILVTEGDPERLWTEFSIIYPLASGYKGHLGLVNFLFADGHVKALKPLATSYPINMWNIEETDDAPSGLTGYMGQWGQKVEFG